MSGRVVGTHNELHSDQGRSREPIIKVHGQDSPELHTPRKTNPMCCGWPKLRGQRRAQPIHGNARFWIDVSDPGRTRPGARRRDRPPLRLPRRQSGKPRSETALMD
jgi:hypothetical protein